MADARNIGILDDKVGGEAIAAFGFLPVVTSPVMRSDRLLSQPCESEYASCI
jgi:hypothetical protein